MHAAVRSVLPAREFATALIGRVHFDLTQPLTHPLCAAPLFARGHC